MSLAANLGGMAISACGCQIGHSFSQTFGAHHHIPHGLGCAWGLPGVMVYTAQYGERSNLEEVADAMDVSYTAETDSMQLAEQLAKRVTRFDERAWYQVPQGFRLYAGGLPCLYRAVLP